MLKVVRISNDENPKCENIQFRALPWNVMKHCLKGVIWLKKINSFLHFLKVYAFKNVCAKGFVWIRKISKVTDVWRKWCAVCNVSMNMFVQPVTKTSNVFFSKNILFYFIILLFIFILLFYNILFLALLDRLYAWMFLYNR